MDWLLQFVRDHWGTIASLPLAGLAGWLWKARLEVRAEKRADADEVRKDNADLRSAAEDARKDNADRRADAEETRKDHAAARDAQREHIKTLEALRATDKEAADAKFRFLQEQQAFVAAAMRRESETHATNLQRLRRGVWLVLQAQFVTIASIQAEQRRRIAQEIQDAASELGVAPSELERYLGDEDDYPPDALLEKVNYLLAFLLGYGKALNIALRDTATLMAVARAATQSGEDIEGELGRVLAQLGGQLTIAQLEAYDPSQALVIDLWGSVEDSE